MPALAPTSRGPHPSRPSSRSLLALVLLAVLVRVAYVVVVMRHYHPVSDDKQYLEMARRFAAGQGIATAGPYGFVHATAFRPPLYPALLGAWFWLVGGLGGSVGAAQVLGIALGSAVVALGAVLAGRVGGRTAGLVAGVLLAWYPPLVANDAAALSEPLALLLLVLALSAVMRRWWWAVGVLVGLLALTRPSAQLVVPVLAVVLWRSVGWRRAAGMVAVAAVVIVPWVVRNDAAVGRPVLVTSNGFNLAAAWSQQAVEKHGFVDAFTDPSFAAVRARVVRPGQLHEGALDAAFRAEGMRGLRQNIGTVPSRLLTNGRELFDLGWRVGDGADRLDGRSLVVRHASLPVVWLVTGLGLVGMVRLARQRDAVALPVAAAYFVAVALVTVSPPRLRAPFDLIACIATGVLLAQGQQVLAARRGARSTSSAAAAALLLGRPAGRRPAPARLPDSVGGPS